MKQESDYSRVRDLFTKIGIDFAVCWNPALEKTVNFSLKKASIFRKRSADEP